MAEPHRSRRGVGALLAARELGAARLCTSARRAAAACAPGAVEAGLCRFLEADSLQRCSSAYCKLLPPPRSTIAAAYSPDGSVLASTQCVARRRRGTASAKRCRHLTLLCFRAVAPRAQRRPHGEAHLHAHGHLRGHADRPPAHALGGAPRAGAHKRPSLALASRRRAPQVRFHPRNSTLLASGSLDYEVRVWDAPREACIASFVFGARGSRGALFCAYVLTRLPGRAIASLAFYPDGDLLAVASGHKVRARRRRRAPQRAARSLCALTTFARRSCICGSTRARAPRTCRRRWRSRRAARSGQFTSTLEAGS